MTVSHYVFSGLHVFILSMFYFRMFQIYKINKNRKITSLNLCDQMVPISFKYFKTEVPRCGSCTAPTGHSLGKPALRSQGQVLLGGPGTPCHDV